MAQPMKPISVTASTVTLDRHIHRDTVTVLNRAAGVTVTLPAASGTGDVYYVMVGTTVTSNNDIVQVANSSDTMVGVLTTATTTTGAGTHEAAGGTDDTITMNGTTTGGIVGSYLELRDVATNVWMVLGHLVGSGTLATPLSAAV
ncbi:MULTISPECIES: hypothetical protein [unclassified Mesorhizobium]|uniref:hypothetical protein n=1 Tax=unclassified Mesorhizobium TaxID=325217 RepID=UPI001FE22596|nr:MULTISPECIES: hypothetical protein [unclassified Mesorhizobium]